MPDTPAPAAPAGPRITPLSSPLDLEQHIARILQRGEPAVLMTVVSRQGSAPRGAGTRALLTADGLLGTVGGGLLEAQALELARRSLRDGRSACHRCVMDGSSEADMICGGSMEVLCEALQPAQAALFAAAQAALEACIPGIWQVDLPEGGQPRRSLWLERLPDTVAADTPGLLAAAGSLTESLARHKGHPALEDVPGGRRYVEALDSPPVLLLCGGGHVSLEVATLAHACGFVVDVADDRAEFATPLRFPMARHCHVLPAFAHLVSACGVGRRHYVAILTRGHSFDRQVLEQVLPSGAAYIGMIGSRTKRDSIYAALRRQGVSEAALAAVYCPIGLPVGADSPQQIAVSIVAELLAARAGTLPRLRPQN